MIVLRESFEDVLHELSKGLVFSIDTETFGLFPFRGHRLFAIIIYDGLTPYYFNFLPYPNVEPNCVLPYSLCKELNAVTGKKDALWFRHNAKFDEHMLVNEGIHTLGDIHDTEVGARIEFNDHMDYSLATCAERIGEKKDDAVMEYLKKYKLYRVIDIPGKKTKHKHYYFDKVPLALMQPYGEKDAVVTYNLGVQQVNSLKSIANTAPPGHRTVLDVMANEVQLTKTCAKIERTGIKIDRDYCEAAAEHERKNYELAAEKFSDMTGLKFVDSAKCFVPAFEKLGEAIPMTDKGNPSFTDDVLAGFKTPLAKVVQEYRAAHMRCNTYFRSFLFHADGDDRIHANIRQSGTKTGRFSYSDPNLQNLVGDEESQFPVRRAFIPSPGFFLASFDYDQVEYRLMLEYAKEMGLIEKILGGLDIHQATADQMGVDRKKAKTLNFMILYGGGVAKLATALDVPVDTARELRRQYFEALPEVKNLIRSVTRTAETRSFVVNWLGRRAHFVDPRFAYRAPNSLIQGGAADAVKVAMNRVDVFLADKKSRMILQVHDSIDFEIHESEEKHLSLIKCILETSFQHTHLPLTVSLATSYKSLGDLNDV